MGVITYLFPNFWPGFCHPYQQNKSPINSLMFTNILSLYVCVCVLCVCVLEKRKDRGYN